MGLVNMEDLCWDDEILNIIGLKEEQLCGLKAPGEIVGEVTKESAAALGLPEGIPVAGGGGDGQCAALGAGVVEEGRASLNMGTAVVSELYSEKYVTDDTFRTLCGCVPGTYVPESIMAAGTFILNWYIKEFGSREMGVSRTRNIPVTKVFEDLAAEIGPGESRLLMLPYLKGASAPTWDFLGATF